MVAGCRFALRFCSRFEVFALLLFEVRSLRCAFVVESGLRCAFVLVLGSFLFEDSALFVGAKNLSPLQMENARLSVCPLKWAVKRDYIACYAITVNL
jgi:hypothetical protein